MMRSYRALITVGFVAIAVSFLVYTKNDSISVTPAAISALQRLAISTYIVFFMSFGAIGWGLYRFYKIKISSADNSVSSIIANMINNKRSKQIFVASAIGYGIFFALASGIILYKPDLNATDYGFTVPHAEIAPCCGLPGYMPMILAFFTEHVGLQIIPLNFVLLVIVSFLVGLNFTISSKTYAISKKGNSLGTFGAITGLFVGCPTCAGTAFTMLFGLGASATSVTFFLTSFEAQLQTMFIVISIPILLITPLLMIRTFRKSNIGNCQLDPRQ